MAQIRGEEPTKPGKKIIKITDKKKQPESETKKEEVEEKKDDEPQPRFSHP